MILFVSCDKEEQLGPEDMDDPVELNYFPPLDNSDWETISPDSLEWNQSQLEELSEWLNSKNTRAFILLKGGKIVYESYWGKALQGNADFDESTNWYWASAGKSLMASMIGKAQELTHLDISEPSNAYLGEGWTSMPLVQENQISIKHHITMTTGLDYTVTDLDCTAPECLQYKADPGTQWYYHNAPYSLVADILENATGMTLNDFTNAFILDKIGMEGLWLPNGDGNLFFSTARSAARFGLLAANEFNWDGNQIIDDKDYIRDMTNSSQELNPSYGYLWWLNGKESVIVPGLPNSFNLPLSESAPEDLVSALGKNGQFIEYSPSLDLVVVRFGDAPDVSPAAINFHDEMWELLISIVE